MKYAYNCAYAVKTRSGIEYGAASVDATSEASAVRKISKKVLSERDDSYDSIVNIIINTDYGTITEQYNEDAIKDINKSKHKKKK